MAAKSIDVVLYGATGFTGRQAARHFAAHAPPGLRWAIAGRNRARLESVRDAEAGGAPSVIVADSDDPKSVDAMVAQARVVLTTAGPFARYGTPVVDACVRHGADYVDITGEAVWVRGLVERYHARAAAQGTRIIPFCGFDSVPSDLGTLFVVSWLRERWGQPTRSVSASFAVHGGGLNGGTLASALEMAEKGEQRAMGDPLLLVPPERAGAVAVTAAAPEFRGVRFDAERGVWLAPFVMAAINTHVVRRSAALMAEYGTPYGPQFEYEEVQETRSRLAAYGIDAALGIASRVLETATGRRLLRRLGPSPGEGPSQQAMDRGSVRVRLLGVAVDGRRALATFAARGDPGNRVTVAILSEAALALATSAREALPGGAGRGGVLTPATGLGPVLLDRLRAVGFTLEARPA